LSAGYSSRCCRTKLRGRSTVQRHCGN